MAPYGGFDHNAQALKIVTLLEAHYADFDGLNLTWETLEGIAKHNGPVTGEVPYPIAEYTALHDLELDTHASAEAQVAAVSDDIAYNNHDLADGLRARLFTLEDLRGLPLIGPCIAAVDARWPGLAPERREHEALRRFFGLLVEDVLATSQERIAAHAPTNAAQVRSLGVPVARFSDGTFAELRQIRTFLYHRMYRHWTVQRMRRKSKQVVGELFDIFLEAPELMPDQWNACADFDELAARARVVADYIGGMTDRFALQEHRRLTDPMVKA
jgi:dGTPase